IADQIKAAGVEPPSRRVSASSAYRLGAALEAIYGLLRIKHEPPMTRFVAAQMATDHYFDISASIDLLGYQPIEVDASGKPIRSPR
ncbi:MAG: hypothetical protein AAF670_21080, partial [Planctomycetota bacterium]